MTRYSVYTTEGESKEFPNLTSAKKFMKSHPGSVGTKTKFWSNGDWEVIGHIKLEGSNKEFVANTKMKKANY